MPALRFDITTLALNGGNAGVQRVSRSLLRHAMTASEAVGAPIEPVVWTPTGFHPYRPPHSLFRRIRGRLRSESRIASSLSAEPEDSPLPPPRPAWKTRLIESLNFAGYPRTLLPLGRPRWTPGDVLLLADSSWHLLSLYRHAARLRRQGVRVGTLVHDVLPLTHPQWCEGRLVRVFEAWADAAWPHLDFALCVSHATADALRPLLTARGLGHIALAVVPEGVDLDVDPTNSGPQPVRPALAAFFAAGPVHAQVGTIEIRKNHATTLAAFERLWESGHPHRLLIAGRPGWRVSSLLARLAAHPERSPADPTSRLAVFHDLTDAEIRHCYQRSAAVICPSLAEGFDLPVVEALALGARVLASDIPVHREVAGDSAEYFAPRDPSALAVLLLATAPAHARHPPQTLAWSAAVTEIFRTALLTARR